MSWVERSGPMARMTEEPLGAKVCLDFAPQGLSWRLVCPAPRALDG